MEITGRTGFTGLIGHPVTHSISPQMHNEAFRLLDLDYVYLAFDLASDDLAAAVDGLVKSGIRGFNVTFPYKTAMLDLVDELTPVAKLAGACNTIINDNGHLIGHTTDGVGFMKSVSDADHNIIGKNMTLLGTGGAATAIATQAALDGVKRIDMFKHSRDMSAFTKKVQDMTGCKVNLHSLSDLKQLKKSIEESDILVNATNVGMAPDLDGCLIPDASYLRPDLIVCDIIYNPFETKLYKMAKAAGCHVFNGLYMLLFQGAASFECWTGRKMPVEEIREKYFKR